MVDYLGSWYQEIGYISQSKTLDDFARKIDDYIYKKSSNWFKRLLYGTAEALIGSIKKYNIGAIYTTISIIWSSIPKINAELGAIRYITDKIRNKYPSRKYRYSISLLRGSHNNQIKLNAITSMDLVSSTIIEFRNNGIHKILRDFLISLKVKLKKYNVDWKYYYK